MFTPLLKKSAFSCADAQRQGEQIWYLHYILRHLGKFDRHLLFDKLAQSPGYLQIRTSLLELWEEGMMSERKTGVISEI